MFIIIVFIVLAIIAALAFVGSRVAKNREDRTISLGVGVIAVVILVITFLATGFTQIGANEVGIQSTFGRVDGPVTSGPHILAPWSDVDRFSTRVQILDLNSKDGNSEGNPVAIKFKGGSGATVSSTTRWRIDNGGKAADLWQKYRTFDAVGSQLVLSSTRDALNTVFAGYTPEEAVDGANREAIVNAVVADLTKKLSDDGVTIDSVSLAGFDLDPNTQARIDAQVQAKADVVRAQTEQEKARIDNATAALKVASLTPAAQQARCLDIVQGWDTARNGVLPFNFTCGFGSDSNVTPLVQVPAK